MADVLMQHHLHLCYLYSGAVQGQGSCLKAQLWHLGCAGILTQIRNHISQPPSYRCSIFYVPIIAGELMIRPSISWAVKSPTFSSLIFKSNSQYICSSHLQDESDLLLFLSSPFSSSSGHSPVLKRGSVLWLALTVASLRQGHVCFMSPSDSFYLQGFPCSLLSKPSSPHRLKGNSGTARCKESIPVTPLGMVSPAALSFFYLFFSTQSPQLIRMAGFSFSALIASAAA